MVRGAVTWSKELQKTNATTGLGPCKAIDQSIEEYRYDNYLSARFIEDCLVRDNDFGRALEQGNFTTPINAGG